MVLLYFEETKQYRVHRFDVFERMPFLQDAVKTLGRATGSVLTMFSVFQRKPILTASEIISDTGLSKPTVIKSINHLINLGIVTKNSEKKWGQIYAYKAYVDH